MVTGDAAFPAAVDLHVGGIQVDRDRALGQRCRPRHPQQVQHPLLDHRDTAFHSLPLLAGDPAGQARRRGRTQPQHRRDLLSGRISALPVQARQEVFPGQLRRRDPGQQLPRPETKGPLADRADRRVQGSPTR
jgi:hypothetical protein